MDPMGGKRLHYAAAALQSLVRRVQARKKRAAQNGFLKEEGRDGKDTTRADNASTDRATEDDVSKIAAQPSSLMRAQAEDRVGVLFHSEVKVMESDGKTWRPGYATLTKTHIYVGHSGERILQKGVGRNLLPTMLYRGEIPSIIFGYLGPASSILAGLAVQTLELGDTPISSQGLDHLHLLEVLPDDARRSRHSKIFPLCISPPSGGRPLIMATNTGKKMWEFAFAVYWRGDPPRSIAQRVLPGCDTFQRFPNPLWVDPIALQRQLLTSLIAFLPGAHQSLGIGSIVRLREDGSEHEVTVVWDDGDIEVRDQEGYYSPHEFEEVKQDKSSVNSDGLLRLEEVPPDAGRRFVRCLVGACVHGAEKNMEMLLSLDLIDCRWAATIGNSPLSMCLEGKYTPERATMANALMNQGAVYPAVKAGISTNSSMIYFLCKPSRIGGLGPYATIGEAVHPDDKRLVKVLIEKGIGAEFETDAKKRINASLEYRSGRLDMSNLASFHWEVGRDGLTTVPREIASLSNFLREIDLSSNVLTELPEEFFQLTSLERVDLSQNCLLEVSPKFKDLANLLELDVSENLVEKLPIDLLKLRYMEVLRCRKNPIKWPPEEIWGTRGNDDAPGDVWDRVRDFFRQVEESGETENVSTKVMVLGRSECGKTSLINALLLEYSKLARKGDRTLGIEQRHWQFQPANEGGSSRPYSLSVLDFAGQDEYYITHHMYLTSRALYIVAFDLSKCEKEGGVEEKVGFYLDLLQTRLGGSSSGIKILVVGTHADQIDGVVSKQRCAMVLDAIRSRERHQIQVCEREISRLRNKLKLASKTKKGEGEENHEYIAQMRRQVDALEKHIRFRITSPDRIHAVSSASDLSGIPELRRAVEFSVQDKNYFPQMCQAIPLFYDNLRNYIRDQRSTKPYYSWEEHVLQVQKNLGSDQSSNAVHTATNFMHDLGELLYPVKGGSVFLDVSWLVDAMKQVIRHDHQETLVWNENMDKKLELLMRDRLHFELVKMKFLNHGELPVELLRYMWSDLRLNEKTFSDIISLLEQFEILVPAVGTKKGGIPEKFLVPTFMPEKLVAPDWPSMCPKGKDQVARVFSCSAGAFPAAMMQRLQVLLCKEAPSIVLARDGALAKWDDQCHVLVKLIVPSRLQLAVRAPPSDRENMFKTMRKLTDIAKTFFQQWPGMVTFEYAQHQTPKTGKFMLFKLDDVVQRRGEGHKCISCSLDGPSAAANSLGSDHHVSILDLIGPEEKNVKRESSSES